MINLKKILKLQTLSFKNGLRLHADSIMLYKNKSFPSAYFMSILALEELGKMYLFDDFLFHSHPGEIRDEEQIIEWLKLMYDHKWKQCHFASFHSLTLSKTIIRTIEEGNLDIAKQNALYVGLPKIKGKPVLKGKINSPFKITAEKTKKQITILNDIVLEAVLGVIKGVYWLQIEDAENLFTWKVYNSLEKNWEERSKATSKMLSELKLLEDEK